jgi:hypothetical protein
VKKLSTTAAVRIAFRDADHQPQVRLDQFAFRRLGFLVRLRNDHERAPQFGCCVAVLFFQFLQPLRKYPMFLAQVLHPLGSRGRTFDAALHTGDLALGNSQFFGRGAKFADKSA